MNTSKIEKIKPWIILTLIIVLGVFLRVYQIENVPAGVYPDEAVNGEDALNAVQSGNWEWFYTANNGREGLYINLIGLCFKFFGVSILTLKLSSIFFGSITILGIYLLTKEIFKKEKIALFASFLVSVSFWAINFSRIGFRAIMLPAVLTFSFYFFWKGIRTKKWSDFAWAGFIFGIGLHTYIAFRIAPLILIFTTVFLIWEKKGFVKEYWKKALIFFLFFLISASPIIFTFVSHPEYLESRSASISILSPEMNGGDLIGTFFRSFGLSLAKYNFWGDQNWRHNYPPYPILNPLVGIFFLFGLFYFIYIFFRDLWRRIRKSSVSTNLSLSIFLLGWFFFMLAPEFMTAEGLPHALRSIGTLPVVYIFAAFSLGLVLDKTKKLEGIWEKFTLSLIICFFIFCLVFGFLKYHVYWAKERDMAVSFEKNLVNIVDYIDHSSQFKEKYVLTGSMQRVPIKLLTKNQDYVYFLYPSEYEKINPQNMNYFEVIMTSKDDDLIDNLKNDFGEMQLIEEKDDMGISFYVLEK